jgi:transposase
MENIYIQFLTKICVKNKYLKWYINIINNGLSRNIDKKSVYVEKHHILPKSFKGGGEKDPANLVYLTAKEHIVIHHLLTKCTLGDNRRSALRAFHSMCFQNNGGQNKRFPSIMQLASAREAVTNANKGVLKGVRGPKWFDGNLQLFTEILQKYVDDGISDPQIGAKYGVSAAIIFCWRRKLKISNRRKGLRDPEYLRSCYIDKKMSAQKIADILGCSATAVQQYLKKFNIPRRDSYACQRNRYVS